MRNIIILLIAVLIGCDVWLNVWLNLNHEAHETYYIIHELSTDQVYYTFTRPTEWGPNGIAFNNGKATIVVSMPYRIEIIKMEDIFLYAMEKTR